MIDLETHRARSNPLFLALLWLHVPLNAIVAWYCAAPWMLIGGATAACALVATAVWRAGGHAVATRATIAVAFMAVISLLLGATSGAAWQVDIHMYYFAGVAMVAIYCDPIAILAAAATVALHHLSLNFLLPLAVYPGGGDLLRVILHAVILVLESAGLIWMTMTVNKMFRLEAEARDSASAASAKVREASEQMKVLQEKERQSLADQRVMQETIARTQAAMVAILADKLSRIAEGDLTARVDEAVDGEFAKVKSDFNAAVEKLEAAMAAVADRTREVKSASGQIAISAEHLSMRTEQQAASLEETNAALTRITETVERSAQGAFHARDVVSSADSAAKSSAVIVRQAVDAMGEITASSSKIGQIIGVIDEIAFQTNLLALNAGVEAARAGDSGRGFAVVASEVRALAQRSAQAAKEIKELISTSIVQVEQGAKLVTSTGASLEKIAATISDINGIVADMAEGAKEQSTGLKEIAQAIQTIDDSTQQNAAMAEEATAAGRSLAHESEGLSGLVTQFRLRASSRPAEAPARVDLARDLRKAAPHAFRAPPAAAPAPTESAPPAARAKKMVNAPRGADDWSEF